MNITALSSGLPALPGKNALPAPGEGGFASAIGAAMAQVEGSAAEAHKAASDLLAGNRGDIHNVALVSQRAEISLELFQQVRNKFVQAYQEVMRMPM